MCSEPANLCFPPCEDPCAGAARGFVAASASLVLLCLPHPHPPCLQTHVEELQGVEETQRRAKAKAAAAVAAAAAAEKRAAVKAKVARMRQWEEEEIRMLEKALDKFPQAGSGCKLAGHPGAGMAMLEMHTCLLHQLVCWGPPVVKHCCASIAVAASPALLSTFLVQSWWHLACFARRRVLGAAYLAQSR